jgi:tetratricopeptide (TPR) repeat protein
MKHLLVSFAILLPHLLAAQPDTAWQHANTLYANGQYADATQAYLQLEQDAASNAALFYNAGNAYYKQGDLAKAILYYERALRLSPDDEDAQYNLALANQQTVDKIEAIPQFFLVTWLSSFRTMFGIDTWAMLAVALLAATLMLALVVALGRSLRRKRLAFATAAFCLALSLTSTYVAFREKQQFELRSEAIVMSPVTSVKASPDGSGVDLFVLHEGSKVTVLEAIGEWKKVKTADGNQGWLPTANIEAI